MGRNERGVLGVPDAIQGVSKSVFFIIRASYLNFHKKTSVLWLRKQKKTMKTFSWSFCMIYLRSFLLAVFHADGAGMRVSDHRVAAHMQIHELVRGKGGWE